MSRAQELVDAHFDHYVGPLLTAAGVEDKVIALCSFMYKSSGIHFYKHAQEDAAEAARGALANDAAHKDMPQVEVNVGETWIIQKANATALTAVVINDISEHTVVMTPQGAQYLDKELQRKQDIRFVERVKDDAAHKAPSLCDSEVDEWADKDLCRRCDYSQCISHGKKDKVATCDTYANRTNQPHLACTKLELTHEP